MSKLSTCFLLPFLLTACNKPESNVDVSSAYRDQVRASMAVPFQGFMSEGIAPAKVLTSRGTFDRFVTIQAGNITCIHWSANNCVPFKGRRNVNGSSSGIMQTGELVRVDLLAEGN